MIFNKKIRKHSLLNLLLCLICSVGFSQTDSVVLSKNFKFQDGIFMTFESFKNNKPTYLWKEVEAGLFSNPKTFVTQVSFLKIKKGKELVELNLEEIWGLSLDGIPYVQLKKEDLQKMNASFVGLQLRGKICYLEYEIEEKRMIPMSVYNPLTGRPFRTMNVERKVPIEVKKMMHFESGMVEDFTLPNLKNWIKEDTQLLSTVDELKQDEIDEKLFKCLLIYVDRNEIMIPKYTRE